MRGDGWRNGCTPQGRSFALLLREGISGRTEILKSVAVKNKNRLCWNMRLKQSGSKEGLAQIFDGNRKWAKRKQELFQQELSLCFFFLTIKRQQNMVHKCRDDDDDNSIYLF